MKNGIFVATIFIVCCIFLLMLLPGANQPDGKQTSDANVDAGKLGDRIANGRLSVEPVKKGLRQLGDSSAANDENLPNLIARLPAKEPPPEPELPKPDTPPKENLVVTIPRPLILAANRVRGEGYDMVLSGIQTVAPGKECDANGKPWPCGTIARTALRKLVRGRTLKCTLGDLTDAKLLPATCSVRGRDLARWLVSQGWAVTTGGEISGYQKRAELQERGLWRGGADAVALMKSDP